MTKKNKRLKKKCIKHWHEILMLIQLNHLSRQPLLIDTSFGAGACAFCREYLIKMDSCDKCPIQMVTGRMGCLWTPYYDVQACRENQCTYKELFKAVTDEINFLESL